MAYEFEGATHPPYWHPICPSEGYIDLHLHSTHSDGLFSPEQLVKAAAKKQLRAIAVTDHDTVSAVRETDRLVGQYDLQCISGVEISAYSKEDGEIHLLGYKIDPENPALLEALERQKNVRLKRIHLMIKRLCELGLNIAFEQVQALARDASVIGRPHLAQAMVQQKIVNSVDEAFVRYLSKGQPGFVPKFGLSHQEAIQAIRQAGGIAIYAHPGLERKDYLIPKLLQLGVCGLEVYHSDHSSEDVQRYIRVVTQYNLLATGGSDCHGGGSKWELLLGTVPVPYALFERLKAY